MDTRKRNALIGAGVAIVVVVAVLVGLMVLGGSAKELSQDKASSGSSAAIVTDPAVTDGGALKSTGDGTANNQVDASEAYGDSAAGNQSGDATGSSAADNQTGNSTGGSAGSGGTSEGEPGGSTDEPTGGADPGVKTESDGSRWTGYY